MSAIPALLVSGNLLTVSVSPSIASGGGSGAANVPPVTASATGGVGGYVYSWSIVEQDGEHPLTINAPNSPTTGFSFSSVLSGELATATVMVTVTSGPQSASAEVPVSFQRW